MALEMVIKVPEDKRDLIGEVSESLGPLFKLDRSIDLDPAVICKLTRA
jgi:hypothetical protein